MGKDTRKTKRELLKKRNNRKRNKTIRRRNLKKGG